MKRLKSEDKFHSYGFFFTLFTCTTTTLPVFLYYLFNFIFTKRYKILKYNKLNKNSSSLYPHFI